MRGTEGTGGLARKPFEKGDEVQLIGDESERGIVLEVWPYKDTYSYKVWFSSTNIQQISDRSLEPYVRPAVAGISTREDFLRDLLLAKLSRPINELLYSFQASRTNFEAYQFKPLLKFLASPVPAILIADEVGLGKTIEAAILMQELKARQPLRRVLVICPAGLRLKWQSELLNRFDEHFVLAQQKEIVQDAIQYSATRGTKSLRAIVSLESFRSREVQEAIQRYGVTFDMAILDEAHHLRTSGTLSNEMGERIREVTEHLVLLTATPLQTSQQDLFNLLRFIDPGQFTSFEDFLLQLEPNARLNEAIRALRDVPPRPADAQAALAGIPALAAADQVLRHPVYPVVQRSLEKPRLAREELVRTVRDLDAMNVLSPIYTRTKKSSVIGSAQRKAHAILVQPTDAEAVFLEQVLEYAREESRRRSGSGWTPGFVGIMRERQAASSISAMRAYLEETIALRKGSGAAASLGTEASWSADEEDDAADRLEAAELLLEAARAVGPTDTKLTRFMEALGAVLAESPETKVIVFTYFRRTLKRLEETLGEAGIQTVVIQGEVKPDERASRVARFREGEPASDPLAPRVLLTTEVGSEGLDFQFCDTLFNYDLPWNPMRVEQRIGRIDRYGQKSPQVRIYSLYMAGTIEERILQRLYARIGIFEQSVGDLEPILGPITHQLTHEVFTGRLSAAQEVQVAEKYAQMVVHRREEDRHLEEQSANLLGQDALLLQAVQQNVRSGRYVSPAELRALVGSYLHEALGEELDGEIDAPSVAIPASARLQNLVTEHAARQGDDRPVTTAFLEKLGRQRIIPSTFDGVFAQQRPRLEFLNLRHPLVSLAIEHHRSRGAQAQPLSSLCVSAPELDRKLGVRAVPGRYAFSIHLLEVTGGIKEIRVLPIVLDEDEGRVVALEEVLLTIVQGMALDHALGDIPMDEKNRLEAVMSGHVADLSDAAREIAAERADGVIAVRQATLERTFRHRITKREELLAQARDRRIITMRTREIANLRDDLARRLSVLEKSRTVSVGSSAVGYGWLTVLRD